MQKKEEKFSSRNDSRTNDLKEQLTKLSEGLFYISETDSPIEVFEVVGTHELSAKEILKQTGHALSEPIEEVSFESFFGRLTTIREWYGDFEKLRAGRFGELKQKLATSLGEPRVFRIGKIRIDIYVVGFDENRNVLGIRTKAVET